jgi:hypothetical protein
MTYADANDSPEWLSRDARREASELRRMQRAEQRKGRPHALDPADPWSEVVRRPCGPGCGHV